jgi:hypothetical protein
MSNLKITSFIIITLISLCFKQESKEVYKIIDGKTIYTVNSKNIYFVESGFMIVADGAPKAYHSDSSKALDYLTNGGKPDNWWALATDNKKKNGNPLVQTRNDPAPGYYISMTSLEDGNKNYADPNRYVDSATIPYIAAPSNLAPDFKLGDIALVINKNNNKRCYAIFADYGPKNKIGEGSIYLAEQLGIRSSPKNGGAASKIGYILFKNSGSRKKLSSSEIRTIGKTKLTEEGIQDLLDL